MQGFVLMYSFTNTGHFIFFSILPLLKGVALFHI